MLTDNKFHFKIISVLELSWQKNTAYAKPRPYHALSLRLEGDATFIHGDRRLKVSKNDLIYVPRDYDYTISSDKNETVLVIHFDILDSTRREMEAFTPTNPEVFLDLFRRIRLAWYKKSVGYEYRVDSLFSRILENMTVQHYRIKGSMQQDFAELLDYIHLNFSDPSVTVESLASRVNVSTAYLREIFSEKMGTTPLKYLRKLRLDYGVALLETGYYTVEEVAELSGYTDPKYFSTSIKRYTGSSPIRIKNK